MLKFGKAINYKIQNIFKEHTMKKYLFNKIKINMNGNVEFTPFRKASIGESFLAYTHAKFDQKNWQFIPVSFKDFLKMLSKTKLNDADEYDVDIQLNLDHYERISFDRLIQIFASEVYNVNAPSEKALQDFYTSAYKIKEEAVLDKKLLETEPEDLLQK